MSTLTAIHYFAPILLLIPLPPLASAPPAPPTELPGIRPISIQTITPRRGLILLTLCLLALTSFTDGVLLVVDLLTAGNRDEHYHTAQWIWGEVVYSLGGLTIWSLAAIFIEWRAKWGDKYLTVLGTLGFFSEIVNLVFLVIREVHTNNSEKIFTILSIPPSCVRLLLLPLLIVLVSSPIIRFVPASESTSLLNDPEDRGREAYGTFEGQNGTENSRGTSQHPTTAGTGANTPAGPKSITIPKTLGADKEKTPPLTWSAFWSRLKKLIPHLWPSTSRKLQFYCVVCGGLLILGRLINPSIPLSLGAVVRALTSNQGGQQGVSPWPPFALYITLRAVQGGGLLSFAQNVLWVPVSQYTDREMQSLCFNHLLNLSLAFHTKRNTGEVLKILDRGSAINNLFQTLLFSALPTMFDIVIAFVIFYVLYGWSLLLVIVAVMSAYVGLSISLTNWRTKLRRLMVDKDIKQRGIASDVLTNWESVKYFTAEQRENRRFMDAILSYQETEAKVMVSFNLLNLVQSFIITLGLLAGSIIIALRVLHGKADAAEFIVFIQYLQQLYGPLDRLGSLYRQINTNTTDAEKLFNLLAQQTEINDKPGAKELVVTDGVVEFDHVCFSYDGKVQALKDVSFTIGKGQSMALVGESGSGKSTILRLLYRFYDLTSGHIYIDGQDISMVTQLSLRKAIGIVPQDSVLWNDTIGANIGYGKEGAEDEDIIAAARAARLHDRILSFSDGYSTIVGERGVRLSGGEKQRVSLARMFLKSPAILVLDEATSALDTETEREIQRALSDLARGRSSLSIAHRLSTIVNSNQIVVMKDGQVIELGDYKTLVDLDGTFAAMWRKQIFTDAEMLASAGGKEEAVLEALPEPEEVLAVEAQAEEAERTGPPSIVHEEREPSEESSSGGQTEGHTDDARASAVTAVEGKPSAETAIEVTGTHDDIKEGIEEGDKEPAVEVKEDKGAEDVEIPAPIVEVPEAKSFAEVTKQSANDEPSAASAEDTIPTAESFAAPSDTAATPQESPSKSSTSIPTPQKASTPFPEMPRLPSSSSHPSISRSVSDSPSNPETPQSGDKKDKSRKRLSSIKGFVRRISDQGVQRSNSDGGRSGLSRSNSYRDERSGGATPEGGSAPGTPNAEEKKKRISFQSKK